MKQVKTVAHVISFVMAMSSIFLYFKTNKQKEENEKEYFLNKQRKELLNEKIFVHAKISSLPEVKKQKKWIDSASGGKQRVSVNCELKNKEYRYYLVKVSVQSTDSNSKDTGRLLNSYWVNGKTLQVDPAETQIE